MTINGAKISSYLYCRNTIEMNYPLEACIDSLAPVCDEIVVVDTSDKKDGTEELLERLSDKHGDKLSVFKVNIPWDAPNHGIYDGQAKAIAREQCTGDILIQMDSDEILEEEYGKKLELILQQTNNLEKMSLMALPIVEYWGGQDKVRVDVNPWKWRISKNDPNITHGIPVHLRHMKDGLLYAMPGTDGCDYIDSKTGKVIPFFSFVTDQVELVRRHAIVDVNAAKQYEDWFNQTVNALPTIYHFSWWSIFDKMKKYGYFWNNFWLSMYGEEHPKPKGWNPFFGTKALETVTEEEIRELALKLGSETGGHIFHSQWVGQKTNSVTIAKPIPSFIKDWCEKNKDK